MSAPDLNSVPLPELYAELASTGLVRRLFELARDEDLGPEGSIEGDATSQAAAPDDRNVSAELAMRGAGIVAGLAAVPDLISVIAPEASFETTRPDGSVVHPRDAVATVSGPARQVLALERPMLNLVGRLSGVATRTARFVQQVERTGAQVLDTRKTTPGLRVLEKYAVRCGGAQLHRIGLYDAVLVKDNHIAGVPDDDLAEIITALVARARRANDDLRFVEIEVDTLEQFQRLLELPEGTIDIVLLDNMDPSLLRRAVKMRLDKRSPVRLEASGGIDLDTIRVVAEAGVDRISVGSLTHGATSLDVGLDFRVASPTGSGA